MSAFERWMAATDDDWIEPPASRLTTVDKLGLLIVFVLVLQLAAVSL